jgi:hypothetical protein
MVLRPSAGPPPSCSFAEALLMEVLQNSCPRLAPRLNAVASAPDL